MIEPILSLSFSMYSNIGSYALLLGSGVSRSAEIPTGWEIVLDLIRKLAHLRGGNCEPDPVAWYKETFHEDTDYSKLLDTIAKTPAERQQLLKSYFEPNEQEQEERLKLPTPAHVAIAELVSGGYVRILITTNFDRLLEKALEAAGITPTVISTPDSVKGALPLTHFSSKCTIIKVHGDYLDTRIKNTPSELDNYDEHLNRLLDRIFDEFGLVICGWSVEWDNALKAAIERCPSHRFTTYWTVRGEPKATAKKLIELRKAEIIKIRGADEFFKELAEKVAALHDYAKPHPLSKEMAVESLKKYISDEHYKIKLHDLIMGETEKLCEKLTNDNFPLGAQITPSELSKRVKQYEACTEMLQALFINGCLWDEQSHRQVWLKSIQRVTNIGTQRAPGNEVWIRLRLYPALLLLYGGGISSIAANKYDTYAALLTKAVVRDKDDRELPLVLNVNSQQVMLKGNAKLLPGLNNHLTPFNDYLFQVLREPFKAIIPDDKDYENFFDRFEYLVSLVFVDINDKLKTGYSMPDGCFGWRNTEYHDLKIMVKIHHEVSREREQWPPFKAGLFDGSLTRYDFVARQVSEYIRRLGGEWSVIST